MRAPLRAPAQDNEAPFSFLIKREGRLRVDRYEDLSGAPKPVYSPPKISRMSPRADSGLSFFFFLLRS